MARSDPQIPAGFRQQVLDVELLATRQVAGRYRSKGTHSCVGIELKAEHPTRGADEGGAGAILYQYPVGLQGQAVDPDEGVALSIVPEYPPVGSD